MLCPAQWHQKLRNTLQSGYKEHFARLRETFRETSLPPGAFSCWCTYHHRARPSANGESLSGAKRAARNRQRRRELVENGSSHGILVYSKDEPVGWCQYGPREELPRFDNYPSYRRPARESGAMRLWRITCFTVDRKHRQQGVASAALKAALQAIRDGEGASLKPILSFAGEPTGSTSEPSLCSRRRDSRSWPPRKEQRCDAQECVKCGSPGPPTTRVVGKGNSCNSGNSSSSSIGMSMRRETIPREGTGEVHF